MIASLRFMKIDESWIKQRHVHYVTICCKVASSAPLPENDLLSPYSICRRIERTHDGIPTHLELDPLYIKRNSIQTFRLAWSDPSYSLYHDEFPFVYSQKTSPASSPPQRVLQVCLGTLAFPTSLSDHGSRGDGMSSAVNKVCQHYCFLLQRALLITWWYSMVENGHPGFPRDRSSAPIVRRRQLGIVFYDRTMEINHWLQRSTVDTYNTTISPWKIFLLQNPPTMKLKHFFFLRPLKVVGSQVYPEHIYFRF